MGNLIMMQLNFMIMDQWLRVMLNWMIMEYANVNNCLNKLKILTNGYVDLIHILLSPYMVCVNVFIRVFFTLHVVSLTYPHEMKYAVLNWVFESII